MAAIIEGQRTIRIRSRRQGAPRSHRHLGRSRIHYLHVWVV